MMVEAVRWPRRKVIGRVPVSLMATLQEGLCWEQFLLDDLHVP